LKPNGIPHSLLSKWVWTRNPLLYNVLSRFHCGNKESW
jgi:hypothetical protein